MERARSLRRSIVRLQGLITAVSDDVLRQQMMSELSELKSDYRPDEIGSPFAISGPGYFTDAAHPNHLHVGFKQEIDPKLMARAKVVTDLTAQAAAIGDLHHAIDCGAMSTAGVHAELAEVVAGVKPGRERADEVTVFDSTGTGLQDVAAAIAVYRIAVADPALTRFDLARRGADVRGHPPA